MVLAGFGLAVVPAPMVKAQLRTGRLIQLLEDHELFDSEAELRLANSSRSFLPTKVRAFIEHAVDFFHVNERSDRQGSMG